MKYYIEGYEIETETLDEAVSELKYLANQAIEDDIPEGFNVNIVDNETKRIKYVNVKIVRNKVIVKKLKGE